MVIACPSISRILMPSLVALLLAVLVAIPAQAASLSASVDREQLALDETLTLTLRYDSRDAVGQPDLSALEPFFDILGQSQSRQLRIINGQSESFTQWQITLAPKQEGRILVPAFELGGARSQPFEVRVTQPVVNPNRAGGDYFMERIVEPETAYVGQQLRVRVRLNTAVGLSELQMTPLEVAGAKLLELEDRQYQRSVNGRPYLVYEKNYALFPEQAGPLTLPSQMLSAVKGASRSLFDINRGQVIRLRQAEQTLTVKAAPVTSDWLPADTLRLEQSFVSNGEVTVGEPVTLQLKLVAEGADPARLPVISPPDLPGVKIYPEPAEDDQQLSANGVVTVRSQRFALVPTETGTLTLPPLRQRWWNSARGRFETAESLALELEVRPGANTDAHATTPAPAPAPTLKAQPSPPTPQPTEPARTTTSATTVINDGAPQPGEPPSNWWLWSQLLWALLSAALAWGWWRARRRPPAAAPATATDSPTQADCRAAKQQLRAACSSRDPAATRQALLAYAQATQLTPPPVTLAALKALAGDELKRQLERLDQALYAPEAGVEVDTGALYELVCELSSVPVDSGEELTLKPLYS